MPNEELIFIIKDEIDHCDEEIRKANLAIERLQEKVVCYNDKKSTLRWLLSKAESEG